MGQQNSGRSMREVQSEAGIIRMLGDPQKLAQEEERAKEGLQESEWWLKHRPGRRRHDPPRSIDVPVPAASDTFELSSLEVAELLLWGHVVS